MDNSTTPEEQQPTPSAQIVTPTAGRSGGGMTFGKTLLASGLGFISAMFLITILLGGLTFMIIGSLASAEVEVLVPEDATLEIALSGSLPESNATASLVQLLEGPSGYTFLDLVTAIREARDDERIRGIKLHLNGFGASTAQLEELVGELRDFRESGKFVYALSGTDGYSEGEYLLASAADSIFLHHSAGIELNGLYVVLEFYKPLMDRLNVDPVVVRAGSYKAAVEPFTRTEASDEFKASISDILGGMQTYMRTALKENRGLAVAEIDSIMANNPFVLARDAVEFGLVDRLVYDDEVAGIFLTEEEAAEDDAEPTMVSIDRYVASIREDIRSRGSDDIAVVYAVGGITSGESGSSANPIMGGEHVGSTSFIDHMREARENDYVKGIVLRIDSPGGELPASVEMWREVSLAAAEKPVVVSMGGSAASGGYYIAAPATEIFADATTITGSIGVFALAFNLDGLYEETIGINTEVIRTAPHADLLSLMRDLTPEEMEYAAEEIDIAYQQFLKVVSDGRDISMAEAAEHAEGRVWTGQQALERGLVDQIGGLQDAIARAAELAEIEEYGIRVIPKELDQIEQIFSALEELSVAHRQVSMLQVRELRGLLERELRSMSGVQARLVGIREVR